jgi:hypothetical protein
VQHFQIALLQLRIKTDATHAFAKREKTEITLSAMVFH